MKPTKYLFLLSAGLFAMVGVGATTPPAAILRCVNEAARDCQGTHSNYKCICDQKDRVLYCLAVYSPYGNYLCARDHFLGTCIDHVPNLVDDPDFNFDIPRRKTKTSAQPEPTNYPEIPDDNDDDDKKEWNEDDNNDEEENEEVPIQLPPDECDDKLDEDIEEEEPNERNCEFVCYCECDEENDIEDDQDFDGIEDGDDDDEDEDEEEDYEDEDEEKNKENEDEEYEYGDDDNNDDDDDSTDEDDDDNDDWEEDDCFCTCKEVCYDENGNVIDNNSTEEISFDYINREDDVDEEDEKYDYNKEEENSANDTEEETSLEITENDAITSEEKNEGIDIDKEVIKNDWACDSTNPNDCMYPEDDELPKIYSNSHKEYIGLPNQYQYGDQKSEFWKEEKKSRAEIIDKLQHQFAKKKANSEKDHLNAVDFKFTSKSGLLKRELDSYGHTRISSAGLEKYNPKKVIFEDGKQSRIRFGSSFLKTERLPKKRPDEEDCE